MHGEIGLIGTLALGVVIAFIAGYIARRLRLPTIVGYLAAGVLIGPFTPGLTADTDIALELAEIGVILLMFGVGIHFSIRDLLAVRSVALPGALGQIAVATLVGVGLGLALGWGWTGGLVLGLSLSVASTVVLLRALEERGEQKSRPGQVAIGWLIVEDLFTIVALVILPGIADVVGDAAANNLSVLAIDVAVAIGRAALLAVLVLVLGGWLVPRVLTAVQREQSRELFTLAVLAVALGVAYVSATLFGASFALGAFLAGAIVGESDHSHQAEQDVTPMRDAFSVIFFVAIGMLLDPSVIVTMPFAVIAVLLVIIVVKAAAALLIVKLLREPAKVGLTVAAGLAQIGEFSFILATLGMTLGLLPPEGLQLGRCRSHRLDPVQPGRLRHRRAPRTSIGRSLARGVGARLSLDRGWRHGA